MALVRAFDGGSGGPSRVARRAAPTRLLSRRWTKPERAEAILEREPWVPLRQGGVGVLIRAAGDPQRRIRRAPAEPASPGAPRAGTPAGAPIRPAPLQLALDPVEDRSEPDELAIGVQAEDGVDERVAAVGHAGSARQPSREPPRPRPPAAPAGRRRRRARRSGARPGPAGRGRACSGSGSGAGSSPCQLHLVDRAAVRPHVGAAGREEVVDGESQARFPVRRGRQRRERGVEVAQVRWAQHDLGEEAGERAVSSVNPRRCRSIAARAIQPPRPCRSATMSPGAEFASSRAYTSSGGGGGDKPLVCGEREPGIGPGEEQPPDHRLDRRLHRRGPKD